MHSPLPPRVLFFAEAATLAHVGRPLVLARELAAAGWQISFARAQAYAWMTANNEFDVLNLRCQPPHEFARRLEAGRPLYDLETLQEYVTEDLALIERVKPDLVIGDFRLSLSVSARLAGVPYATICDAYWSPETPLDPALPVLPFTRFVPIGVAERVFRAIAPVAFRLHARPMEALRRTHGLPGFGHDLRLCYTDADLRLFANPPELFPGVTPHAGAQFIGPIAWSPECDLPEDFPREGGHIYVSMGSSGSTRILSALYSALAEFDDPVVVTTAGRPTPPPPPPGSRIRSYDFLPGPQAMSRAKLVICNGGSPATNQALVAGVPILGIPTNMDQFLNMRAIEARNYGFMVRSDRSSTRIFHQAISDVQAHRAERVRCAPVDASQPPNPATMLAHLQSLTRGRPSGTA